MKMKREYTKPVVELVKFELNDAIASCKVVVVTVAGRDNTDCRVPGFEGATFIVKENCSTVPDVEIACYNGAEETSFFTS